MNPTCSLRAERNPPSAIRSPHCRSALIIEVLTMLQWIYIACHGVVTLIGLFGFWIRLEHRLTKIEMNVKWIMQSGMAGCAGKDENEEHS